MNVFVMCEDCQKRFEVNGDNLHRMECKTVDTGKSIKVLYYDCPSCARRHYVQVDDATSQQKLALITREFARMAVAKSKGKHIPQKQLAKFKEDKQHLSDYRTALMKELTGRAVRDEAGAVVTLRFSV